MSIVLSKENFTDESAGLLTVCTSVAVCRAVRNACCVEAGIKWVNDIFFNGRKVCGILCEAVGSPVTHYIVGVGINIGNSEFPEEIKNVAGSIPCDEGAENMLAACIAKEIYSMVENFDAESIINEYRADLMMIGKEVKFTINGEDYVGIAYGVNDAGNLIVRCEDGIKVLSSGEISLGSSGFAVND